MSGIHVGSLKSPTDGKLLVFSVPLSFSPVPLGTLYLGFSERSIETTLARVRNQTLLITAIMLALGVAGAITLSSLLSRPIFRLVQATKVIGQGDFDVSLPVTSRDELGALTSSFNQMVLSLREKARIEAERSRLGVVSQHKSEFLATMSHELRTPLNAVIGFSEVLAERMFGDLNPKQQEYVDDIQASERHLLALINDILDLSKIEAGRLELELAPFDVQSSLENSLLLVRERAARHGIALELSVDNAVSKVIADERRFRQVMLNLLSNAVKFTPSGGRIAIRAVARPGLVEIAVSDTGQGIPAEDPLLADAQEAMQRGAFSEALSDVERLLAGQPNNAEALAVKKQALYRQARAHLGARSYDESYKTLTALARLAPDYEDSAAMLQQVRRTLVDRHYSQGLQLYRQEKLTEAIGEWRIVLELDPQHANARPNIEQAEKLIQSLDERRKR